jgi:glycosyltransferase involved in cell wall biosynthesis
MNRPATIYGGFEVPAVGRLGGDVSGGVPTPPSSPSHQPYAGARDSLARRFEGRRTRVAWFVRKYMDTALDAGTWVEMVRALDALGTDVTLLCGYRRQRLDLGIGARLHYLGSPKMSVLNALGLLESGRRAIRDVDGVSQADVVIVDPTFVLVAAMARRYGVWRRQGPRIVVDVRTVPIQSGRRTDSLEVVLFRFAMRLAGRYLDGACTITSSLAEKVSAESGFAVEDIGIWSSGVDVDAFVRGQPAGASGRALRWGVIYHGQMLSTRGVGTLVEAMRLVEDRIPGKVSLTLLGGGPDAGALRQMVERLALGDAVALLPPVDRAAVPALLRQADAGVVPFPDLECWRVSSPLKLLEYLAMNMPVIATRVKCTTEVVGDKPFVVWARSCESGGLADAIIAAYEKRDELTQAATAARELVVARFTWQAQARLLLAFLNRVERRG